MNENLDWRQLLKQVESLKDAEALKIGTFILDNCKEITCYDDLDDCLITIYNFNFSQKNVESRVDFIDIGSLMLEENLEESEKYDEISEETIKNYQEGSLLEGDADSLELESQSFDSGPTSFDSDEISE